MWAAPEEGGFFFSSSSERRNLEEMNRRTFSLETHRRCSTTTNPPRPPSPLIKRAVRGNHFSLGKSKQRGVPVFLELRAALWTPPPVAGGHRHRAMMTLRRGADSLSTRWLLPLQYQTVVEECMGGGVKGSSEEKCSCSRVLLFFFIQLCDGCNFLFFYIFYIFRFAQLEIGG